MRGLPIVDECNGSIMVALDESTHLTITPYYGVAQANSLESQDNNIITESVIMLRV